MTIGMVISFVLVNSTDSQAASYDKAYASKTLTVKSSPGTSYKTLGKIKVGSIVKVYGGVSIGKDQGDWYSYQQYGWSKIKYKNKTAWVKAHELNFSNPYSWVPGIKTKTLKEVNKNYVSKGDKTKLVKSNVSAGQGYYIYYIKIGGKGEWSQLVVINCKTGWYHG